MPKKQLPRRPATTLSNAEDAIAFFAKAAVLRHWAELARTSGLASEATRLEGLAAAAETIVATVVARIVDRLCAPTKT
jgi:hypothetical protein